MPLQTPSHHWLALLGRAVKVYVGPLPLSKLTHQDITSVTLRNALHFAFLELEIPCLRRIEVKGATTVGRDRNHYLGRNSL